jgi:hydroxymethylbilane synthase
VRLATRGSALALAQTALARAALSIVRPDLSIDVLEVRTEGDRLQDVSLESVEGRGFFTDALEKALLDGRAEAAVHSLKDLPVQLAPGLEVASVLEREDPRDAIVSPHGGLAELPLGARVGTDSSRRRAQLASVRPDLEFVPVRGNVPTRLRKLDAGDYDALVLAAAGLLRLGLQDRLAHPLDPAICLPAPGQGAIAIETLGGEWAEIARATSHQATSAAVAAERACLEALGGGCQAPVGTLATCDGDRLRLEAVLIESRQSRRVEVEGPVEAAEECGRRAARRLR